MIYLIVKIVVIISRPVRMELVLRKRIAVTMGKTEGWWSGKALRNLLADVRLFLRFVSQPLFPSSRKNRNERASSTK